MLQSEFQDRTGISLTGEEYAKVEHIYLCVQMDKDDFCRLWLENRDNQLVNELMVYIECVEQKLLHCEDENTKLNVKCKESETQCMQRVAEASERWQRQLEHLCERIIDDIDDETRIYDHIEEELTIDFIIKYKLKNGYDLESHEREYLINKL